MADLVDFNHWNPSFWVILRSSRSMIHTGSWNWFVERSKGYVNLTIYRSYTRRQFVRDWYGSKTAQELQSTEWGLNHTWPPGNKWKDDLKVFQKIFDCCVKHISEVLFFFKKGHDVLLHNYRLKLLAESCLYSEDHYESFRFDWFEDFQLLPKRLQYHITNTFSTLDD